MTGEEYVYLNKDRGKINTVMTLRVPRNRGIPGLVKKYLGS
jgi:hypothetical protein